LFLLFSYSFGNSRRGHTYIDTVGAHLVASAEQKIDARGFPHFVFRELVAGGYHKLKRWIAELDEGTRLS
jgi:hypothetical protein